jgi:hypothetical protein
VPKDPEVIVFGIVLMRKDFTWQWVALGMAPDLANIINTEICAGFVVQTTLNSVLEYMSV